jgi:hypothetical protein
LGAAGGGSAAALILGASRTTLDAAVLCGEGATTIFGDSVAPLNPHFDDFRPVTLGVKFRSDVDGLVSGVRFYKDSRNSGTHIGMLWSSTGALLASATFSETASGWQEVTFSSPVAITAGTTYVASYHTATGYPQDMDYFTAEGGVYNPPLRALQDGVDGGNGVYAYDSSSGDILFPSLSFRASNYYVDVVFAPAADCDDGNPCTDDSCGPTGCVHTNNTASCDDGNPCTVGDTCSGGSCLPGTSPGGSATIFDALTAPVNPHFDDLPVTLGVKFRTDVDGLVSGIRFYKDARDNGAHVGMLWSGTGTLLASATFAETDSGWQQVAFSSPVSITANTTYVASYHTETGYPQDLGYFTLSGVDNPPLHALQDGVDGGNGVYAYDTLTGEIFFPSQSFDASNYYVDVVFTAAGSCDDDNPCTDDVCGPTGCVNTPKADGTTCNDGSACTQTDTCQSGQCQGADPVVCTASDPCHVAGTCDPATGACDSPPASDGTACDDRNACTRTDSCVAGVCTGSDPVLCAASDQCRAGVCDPASGACSELAVPDGTACTDANACTLGEMCVGGTCRPGLTPPSGATIFSASTTPVNPHFSDDGVTLGVRFVSDMDGFVTGIRFYKDPRNNGIHTGELWDSTGTLLASAAFTESASGWQQVNFGTPVPITASTTYVASYHTETGYPQDLDFFTSAGVDNPPLHALQDGAAGPNGVYTYDPPRGPGGFPAQGIRGSNYYVDVVFDFGLCFDSDVCTSDSCDPAIGCIHGVATLTEVKSPVTFQTDNVTTLQWLPTPDASAWNTYRGTLPPAGLGSRPSAARYDHVCFEKGDALEDGATRSTDLGVPPAGQVSYYLVSGRNDTCSSVLESTLGSDSSGHEIPNSSPCQ